MYQSFKSFSALFDALAHRFLNFFRSPKLSVAISCAQKNLRVCLYRCLIFKVRSAPSYAASLCPFGLPSAPLSWVLVYISRIISACQHFFSKKFGFFWIFLKIPLLFRRHSTSCVPRFLTHNFNVQSSEETMYKTVFPRKNTFKRSVFKNQKGATADFFGMF